MKFLFIMTALACIPSFAWACSKSLQEKQADFAKLDTDHDGFVAVADYINAGEPQRQEARQIEFGKMDTNHDNKISQEEYIKFDPWAGQSMRPRPKC